jgi:hypothetical protein
MKTALWSAFFAALVFSACGGKKTETTDQDTTVVEGGENDSISTENATNSGENKAVVLWNASILSMPSAKEGKWVASYQFGNLVELQGSEQLVEAEKRTYIQVMGPDGKSGWINKSLLAANAVVGVCVSNVSLFKNPDVMSVSGESVQAGTIVALSNEDKQGFRHIYTKEKKIGGYINNINQVSVDPLDLKVAVLYIKAMAAADDEAKKKALQAIIDETENSSSKLFPIVRGAMAAFETAPDMEEIEEVEGDI